MISLFQKVSSIDKAKMEKILEAYQDALTAFKSFPDSKPGPSIDNSSESIECFSDIEELKVPMFSSDEILEICAAVQPIFALEPLLIHLEGEFIVIGDLHGHLPDLYRIFCLYGLPPNRKYLFLGDLIDRGDFSLPLILFLFALKSLYPQHIYILRGNHEFATICSTSGFLDEIEISFGYKTETTAPPLEKSRSHAIELPTSPNCNICLSHNRSFSSLPRFAHNHQQKKQNSKENLRLLTRKIFDTITDVFSFMPISAVLNKDVICLHGGIGPTFHYISQIDNVVNPLCDFYGGIVNDILWSDPNEQIDYFATSQRNIGSLFGQKAINDFLSNNGLRLLVRGHEPIERGCEYMLDRKVLTIFSASNYCNNLNNHSSILFIYPDKEETLVQLPPFDKFMKSSDATYVLSKLRNREKASMNSKCCHHSHLRENEPFSKSIKGKHISYSLTDATSIQAGIDNHDENPSFLDDNGYFDENDEIEIDDEVVSGGKSLRCDAGSPIKIKGAKLRKERSLSNASLHTKRKSSGGNSQGKKKTRRTSESINPGGVSIVPHKTTPIGGSSF